MRAHAHWIACAVLAAVYAADALAPPAVGFDIFYLIPIGIIAWYRRSSFAYLVAIGAMLADVHNTYLAEATATYPWLTIYRGVSSLVLFSTFCFIVVKVRRQFDQVTRSSETLAHIAYHDRLTGLPNRSLLFDRLARAISRARRDDSQVALMLLDLDGFKQINDNYGHHAGDDVLKTVASRLADSVRDVDTVARLGGDEFAVVMSDVSDDAGVRLVAQKLLAAVAEPIHSEDQRRYRIGVSIGISLFPRDGSEIDRLLTGADQAMYSSKDAGKNQFTFAQQAPDVTDGGPWMPFHVSYETGVGEIDFQHRRLVELINHVNNAIKGNEPSDLVLRVFDELIAYTRFHFATEAQLMKTCDYPDQASHLKAHDELLTGIGHIQLQMETPGRELVVLQLLKDWLSPHIEISDKALGEYLKICVAKPAA